MKGKREALGLELRGIIGTDKRAADIIAGANTQKRTIEESAAKQKALILEDAQKRRELVEKQVAAEQEAALEASKKQAEAKHHAAQQGIAAALAQGEDRWVSEILSRILRDKAPRG